MAHGIYSDRDFQVAETMAWHKLTRIAKPAPESFPEIVPMPMFYNGGKDAVYGDKRYVIPVAKDDMLPCAPPYCEGTYTLFTPREAWAWVASVLEGTGYNVQSIGMLWNRSFWFMSTNLSELQSLSVGDGRKVDFQLNFSGGLDRSESPQCELSSIVAVCHNTISLSRTTGRMLFHSKLTSGFGDRLAAAKNEVSEAVGMTAVFKAAMDGVAKNLCDAPRARRIFAGYVTPDADKAIGKRTANTVDELCALHRHGTGNHGATEFDLLNAYTEHATHGSRDSRTPVGKRFASSEFGNAADDKADFCRMLTSDRTRLDAVEFRGRQLLAA